MQVLFSGPEFSHSLGRLLPVGSEVASVGLPIHCSHGSETTVIFSIAAAQMAAIGDGLRLRTAISGRIEPVSNRIQYSLIAAQGDRP